MSGRSSHVFIYWHELHIFIENLHEIGKKCYWIQYSWYWNVIFHSLWIEFLETSRRVDLSSRSLGHVMFSFAGAAHEAGAGGRSGGAAGIPVQWTVNRDTSCPTGVLFNLLSFWFYLSMYNIKLYSDCVSDCLFLARCVFVHTTIDVSWSSRRNLRRDNAPLQIHFTFWMDYHLDLYNCSPRFRCRSCFISIWQAWPRTV